MESLWWIFAGVAGFAMLSLISAERQREIRRIEVEKQVKDKLEKAHPEEPSAVS